MKTRRLSLLAVVFAAMAAVGNAQAGATEMMQVTNHDKHGVALQGYDPVAYFTDQNAVKGDPKYSYAHHGATYYFATADHRDMFAKNPEHYVPKYGGYCAYGVSQGHAAPVDPEAFTVVDGKLYLNYSKKVRETWKMDRDSLIGKADSNWPSVLRSVAGK